MARGLLEDDHEWRICLEEAIAMQPGMACRRLLADEVAEPHVLWDQFKAGLCDDVKHKLHHMNHYQTVLKGLWVTLYHSTMAISIFTFFLYISITSTFHS